MYCSRRRVLLHNLLDLLLVRLTILLEQIVRFGLCRRFGIGVIKEVLDTKKDLLDRDRRLPPFLFVEDRETDSTGRVDVRVE